MASFVRTTISLVLLLAAVGAALAGLGAHWLDRVARTPAPLHEIAGPLASDQRVMDAIAVELSAAAVARLPAAVDLLPGVRTQLEDLIGLAVHAALTDDGVTEAWHEAIDRSRADFVTGLDAMRTDGADAPTLWLPLAPFVEEGQARLLEMTPELLRPLVIELDVPAEELRIALGRPDTVQAGYAADGLAVARHWIWFYAAATLLAVLGLAVGSRRGRWVAWTLAAVAGMVAVTLGRRTLGGVSVPDGSTLAAAVQSALVEGTMSSLQDWTAPAVTVGWALLAFGVLGLVVSAAGPKGRVS